MWSNERAGLGSRTRRPCRPAPDVVPDDCRSQGLAQAPRRRAHLATRLGEGRAGGRHTRRSVAPRSGRHPTAGRRRPRHSPHCNADQRESGTAVPASRFTWSSVGRRGGQRSSRRRARPHGRRCTPRVGLWVTRITVRSRSSTASRRTSRSSRPLRLSRFPVGSSASNSPGHHASARAATARLLLAPRQVYGAAIQEVAETEADVDHFVNPIRGRVVCPAMTNSNTMSYAMSSPGWRLKPWNTTPTAFAPYERAPPPVQRAELHVTQVDLAGRQAVEAGQTMQQRRLSRSRWSYHRGQSTQGRNPG